MNNTVRNPWRWIPTLYFGQGLPYVVVMTLAVVMYKNLGVSNTEIALYTSWLYLPWVIKPLWSPLVDLLGTQAALDRRRCSSCVGAALAMVALTLPAPQLPAADAGGVLADGLRLGHARHRRRRLLHAGAAAAHAGRVRRRAQHLLPAGDDRRPGRAGRTWPGWLQRTQRAAPARPGRCVFGLLAALFVVLAL